MIELRIFVGKRSWRESHPTGNQAHKRLEEIWRLGFCVPNAAGTVSTIWPPHRISRVEVREVDAAKGGAQ